MNIKISCLRLIVGSLALLNAFQAEAGPVDVRSRLLASAKRQDPDFPDGRSVLSTHFSHVCEVMTRKGARIYVADRRAVPTGMPSPRGSNYIVFFDATFRYLGKIGYAQSLPLWCEGSRLYLWGDLDMGDLAGGNVVDLAEGYGKLKVYHASAYGSSGGINE